MRLRSIRFGVGALAIVLCGAGLAELQRGASAEGPGELALQIADYAALPITGSPDGTGNNAGSLARVNFLREEPAPARRFFVNDRRHGSRSPSFDGAWVAWRDANARGLSGCCGAH